MAFPQQALVGFHAPRPPDPSAEQHADCANPAGDCRVAGGARLASSLADGRWPARGQFSRGEAYLALYHLSVSRSPRLRYSALCAEFFAARRTPLCLGEAIEERYRSDHV